MHALGILCNCHFESSVTSLLEGSNDVADAMYDRTPGAHHTLSNIHALHVVPLQLSRHLTAGIASRLPIPVAAGAELEHLRWSLGDWFG